MLMVDQKHEQFARITSRSYERQILAGNFNPELDRRLIPFIETLGREDTYRALGDVGLKILWRTVNEPYVLRTRLMDRGTQNG